MVRRQFGELNRLSRKANAADDILTALTGKTGKKILSEDEAEIFIQSDGNFSQLKEDGSLLIDDTQIEEYLNISLKVHCM